MSTHDADPDAPMMRWRTLPVTVEALLEALHGDAVGTATVVNLLAEATPSSEFGHADKTLGQWTRQDWEATLADRYEEIRLEIETVQEFDDTVTRIVAAMDRAGVHQTGDLFPSSHDGDAA